jgi:3-hydroxyacyl-CoA dehydrogenase
MKGKMTEERYEKAMSLVTGVLDYERFKDVDLVIEASLYPLPCHHSCIKRYLFLVSSFIIIHLLVIIAGSY